MGNKTETWVGKILETLENSGKTIDFYSKRCGKPLVALDREEISKLTY